MSEYLVLTREDWSIFDIVEIPENGFGRGGHDSDMRCSSSSRIDHMNHAVGLGFTRSFVADEEDVDQLQIDELVPEGMR